MLADEEISDRIFWRLAYIREHGMVAVDSSTFEAKKRGELIGYDGFKHRKSSKIDVVVDEGSCP